jgi:hypothetical protein
MMTLAQLPPPRVPGLAWRNLSSGAYGDPDSCLERIYADLASDYGMRDPSARAQVWEIVLGGSVPASLHEIVLRYEAEAARYA